MFVFIACLQCLENPILYGDRFFLFVCSICNGGNEFLTRLPMRWLVVRTHRVFVVLFYLGQRVIGNLKC